MSPITRAAFPLTVLSLILSACSSTGSSVIPAAGVSKSVNSGRPTAGVAFKVLNSFGGGSTGWGPTGGVVFDSLGNAYGSTALGGNTSCQGNHGCGLIYELNASRRWKESVIYTFTGGSDGAQPDGTLAIDAAGNLYGTAYRGGTQGSCGGCGVVFELTRSGSTWQEHVLYSFTGGADGNWPGDGVVFDKSGNLYGTTFGAQSPSNGSVFELSPSGSTWKETTLHTFAGGLDGAFPFSVLTIDKHGNLYGDTEGGAGGAIGTVFELSHGPSGWKESVLARLDGGFSYGQGITPIGTLALDSAGNIYGTTYAGGGGYCPDTGYHCGLVYELIHQPSGWQESVLYEFTGGTDGATPRAGVLLRKGVLYGTTYQGGNTSLCYPIAGCGVIYSLTPSGSTWTENVLDTFSEKAGTSEGAFPISELTLHLGNLFSTTYGGGNAASCTLTTGCGEVFKAKP